MPRARRFAVVVAILSTVGASCTQPPTTVITPLTGVAQISAGGNHSCVVLTSGGVKCWGNNTAGQLGNPLITVGGYFNLPVPVTGLPSAIDVAAGSEHTCALVDGGAVWCWGDNTNGQLGDGTTTDRVNPVQVQGLVGATQIASDGYHSCAVLIGGEVSCWGRNYEGELGNGSTTDSALPTAVTGITDAVHTTAGCALAAGGTVSCWGPNRFGELGNGTTTPSAVPVPVAGLANVISIAGQSPNACALASDGTITCWGSGRYGQIGDGTMYEVNPLPMEVTGIVDATEIAVGGVKACAVLAAGTSKCWGYNGTGALGDGTTIDRNTPVDVDGISSVAQIAPGGASFGCARLSVGTVKCWGQNYFGELGNSSYLDSLAPTNVLVGL